MKRNPIQLLQNLKPTPFQLIFNAATQMPDLVNLGIGEPDLDAPREVREALAEAAGQGYTHYPPLNGYADLREEIAAYWKRTHGLDRGPGEVMVTAGCTQAIDLVLRAFVGPGDEVLVTDPCFSSYVPLVSYTGALAVSVPVKAENGFVLDAVDLERRITPKTKLLLLNSPCNPTGAVYDRATLSAIAAVVEKHDLLVISDEIYEGLVFDGEHTCFATLPGMRDRTFTMGGFSKTYAMTGLRLGYVIADASYFPALSSLGVNMIMSVNAAAQRAGVAALRRCRYFVDDMVRLYKERANRAAALIEAIPRLSCVRPGGTFYLMMNVSETGLKSLDFAMGLLEAKRVAAIAGIAFGQTADDYVRISYNGSPEALDEAFGRIGDYVASIR